MLSLRLGKRKGSTRQRKRRKRLKKTRLAQGEEDGSKRSVIRGRGTSGSMREERDMAPLEGKHDHHRGASRGREGGTSIDFSVQGIPATKNTKKKGREGIPEPVLRKRLIAEGIDGSRIIRRDLGLKNALKEKTGIVKSWGGKTPEKGRWVGPRIN